MSGAHVAALHPVIPVIVIDDPADARDLALALGRGGIHCAEVTLRTPAAIEALRIMSSVPDFTAGVGTVRSFLDLEQARAAGAAFVVSPGLDEELVAAAADHGLDVLPGVATATEVQRALRLGLRLVKFFPADVLGGLGAIRALRGPFPEIGFVPSGGVTAASAAEYLADPGVPAVSGSWMATRDLIARRDFAEIERLSAETTAAIGAL
jgi:2-dehydro-3-deoxyphosphogluconate aldolase / (4S)-4-hydroxy-2-oxoglutarate aldolase